VKARKVKDLDPDGLLVDNMRRVILVRLDELYSFIPDALDPEKIEELHDMRIAAKRLRYLLELSESLFGKPAKKGAKVVKDIQGMLGEIHDCDELLPLVEGHVARMRSEDAAHAVAAAPDDAEDLAPMYVADAPNRTRYRGLELLLAYTEGRRSLLHSRFVREWSKIEESGFRAMLEDGLAPVASEPATPRETEEGQEST
jgi:hypothetical protein